MTAMPDLDPDAQEQAAYQDNPAYKRTLHDDWFMATYPKHEFIMRNVNVRLDDTSGQYVLRDDAPQVIVIFHDGTISLNGDKRHGNWRAKNRGVLIVMEIAFDREELMKKNAVHLLPRERHARLAEQPERLDPEHPGIRVRGESTRDGDQRL